MSITHNFRFQSDQSAEEVFEKIITKNFGLQAYASRSFITVGKGIYGAIHQISLNLQRDFLQFYGIRADLEASFTEDSDGDLEVGEKIMGKIITFILQQETGDAILFYVIDTPILERKNGYVRVAEEKWFQWLRDGLDEAGLHYESKPTEQILENRDG
jgi:hypothetical protein